MKSKIFFAGIAALVAVFALQPQQANAKIWRVNNQLIYVASATPGQPCSHCFTNLQSAINDSDVADGDTLHIEASPISYGGGANQTFRITINKRLVLLGPGYFLDENHGLQWNLTPATIIGVTLAPGSEGTILKGLSIGFSAGTDVRINADNVTIERCRISQINFENDAPVALNNIAIRQNYIGGIEGGLAGQGSVNNLILSNNYIGGLVRFATSFQGIAAQNVFDYNSSTTGVAAYSDVKFYNNIFRRGILLQNNNSVGNVYNNIFHALPAWLDGVAGNTNISKEMDQVFIGTGSTDGQYRLKDNCCPSGANGHQIGMYGGNDPYREGGVPDIPAIYFLWQDATVVQGDNLPVTIRTRTNN